VLVFVNYYIVISFAVLWQHVFRVVVLCTECCAVCTLHNTQYTHHSCHNTAKLITMYIY